jgi:hypothetical protein
VNLLPSPSSIRPTTDPVVRHAVLALWRLLAAALVAAALVGGVGAAAGAQPVPRPGDPPPAVSPDDAEGVSNAGGVVFLAVSAVIIGGAVILYLRHRPSRPPR